MLLKFLLVPDNTISIVTGWIVVGAKDGLWGPPFLILSGYWGSSSGIKWLGCDVDHSVTRSFEVKIEYSCTSAVLYAFMVWTGTKFTFTLIFMETEVKYKNLEMEQITLQCVKTN